MARIVVVFFLLGSALLAQSPTWDNVKHLPSGSQVRLTLTDGRKLRGGLQNVTDDSLMVTTAGANQTVERSTISKIAVKGESHRGRNALIGLGVGAGLGLAAGAGIDGACGGDCLFGRNIGKVAFTPVGALLGFGIGVAIPTGGWHSIYRAK